MKILHVIHDLSAASGGPTSALANLAVSQERAGLNPRVITHTRLLEREPSTSLVDALSQEQSLDAPPRRSFPLAAKKALKAEALNHDVVHIHGVWEPIQRAAAHAAVRAKRPVVLTPHGMLTRWAWSHSPIKKYLYFRMAISRPLPRRTLLHFASQTEEKDCVHAAAHYPHAIVPLGIDVDVFKRDAEPDYLKSLTGGAPSPYVLFVGRVFPGKGVEHLIAAAKQLAASSCTIVIVGPADSSWAQQLQQRAAVGKGARVIFTGPLPLHDVARALASTDVYCLPSDHENFGMAAVEAMAAGAPSLLSREVAVAKDAVEAGAATYCRRDPAGLAEDLIEMIGDSSQQAVLSRAARSHATKRYALSVTSQAWRDAYRSLVADTPERPTAHK